ncbi:coenzyme F420-0:L-glutamate ligase [Microvirga sp. SRT01]|uniref:Coenzyme F420-0:L-glutamate ligase n=1 Tax=Sphingomonas longa TaxID=2778730 RepID=A0ABS2DA55_9SPHN|nr:MULTISPECIES: coenzyme F420-0:L-glutamate ligase [Alphaproteobacteria]MBM6577834.1 coenzyme F420-0:L-glutamate ligase [Sphingomonas sp. BT552]MBR7710876.1 coenzyme F420-0:L-glutamate ligase [Microvirga sp. SRT01]
MIRIEPVTGLGEIAPGDDLADLLRPRVAPAADTVLVVTQKIVSKAEDRYVDLHTVRPGATAIDLAERTRKDPRLVELVLAESSAVVRAAPNVLITRHRTGHVMANAGIDQSNIGAGGNDRVLLLPLDADTSAAALHDALGIPVVIADSFGRPWRYGTVNVAIGAAGLPSLVDQRGDEDRDGRTLQVTQVALADMIASAAGLAMGEASEGIPAAIVHGLAWHAVPRAASALVRPLEEDLFR